MVRNQSTMTGPKTTPMRSVPRRWTRKSATRMAIVIGTIHVESSGDENPLPQLRAQLDAWRVQHPCPVTTTKPATKSEPSCSCGAAGARPDEITGWLLGGLLIVAGWRQRAARQLRPIQAP